MVCQLDHLLPIYPSYSLAIDYCGGELDCPLYDTCLVLTTWSTFFILSFFIIQFHWLFTNYLKLAFQYLNMHSTISVEDCFEDQSFL